MNSAKYRTILKTCFGLKENCDWEDFLFPYKTPKHKAKATQECLPNNNVTEKGQISLDLTPEFKSRICGKIEVPMQFDRQFCISFIQTYYPQKPKAMMVPLLNTDFICAQQFCILYLHFSEVHVCCFHFGIIHVYHQGHKILITSTVIKRCKTKHKKLCRVEYFL